jgi:ferredoxin
MNDVDESLAGPPKTDTSRRRFLRKVLGIDTFGETVANLSPASDKVNTSSYKTISIRIDPSRCSACGQCSRFCLPGALKLTESDGSFSLRFLAAACIDCGLCSSVCPEGALELDETPPAEPGPLSAPVEVAAGPLGSCVLCHAPVAEIVGHSRCFVCRQRSSPPSYLSAP